MKQISMGHFYGKQQNKRPHFPLSGQIELTYRCNLNCIHCFCKGLEDKNKELSTPSFKKILDEIAKEGCLYLCLTGGEPLVRGDFLELYSYAKQKGFIITIFSNGQAFTSELVSYLVKSPPFSIEITLNGITPETYESITQVKGSFDNIIMVLKAITQAKLPLVLKSNCLKENKHEIGRIKAFAEKLLGRPSPKLYNFKYDPMIYPRLNGDKTPCQHRLSFAEMKEVKKQDSDIKAEYQKGLHSDPAKLERDRVFLYRCNSWMSQFFISPYGRMRFCGFSEKFSIDLTNAPFREGFYKIFPQILEERFKTGSRCKDCRLRPLCYHCPGRAHLETGDEEAPVPYYCGLAEAMEKELILAKSKRHSKHKK